MIKITLEDSYKDLVFKLNDATPGSDVYNRAKTILEAKIMLQNVKYSEKLNRATWILAFATIGLLIATIALTIKK